MEWNHEPCPALTHNFSECRGCISHHRGSATTLLNGLNLVLKMSMQAWSFNLHMDKVIGTCPGLYWYGWLWCGVHASISSTECRTGQRRIVPVHGIGKAMPKGYGAASEYYQKAIQWGLMIRWLPVSIWCLYGVIRIIRTRFWHSGKNSWIDGQTITEFIILLDMHIKKF